MKGLIAVWCFALLIAATAAFDNLPERCPEEQETDWTIEQILAHPDCNKFYKCVYGKPVEMNCPGGLYFNVDLLVCDYPEETKCENRLSSLESSSESESDESDESDENGNGSGRPKPGGNGRPKPGGNGRPKPGDNGKPKPGDNGKPKPGDNGKPKPGGNGKPKPGGNGNGNGKPKPGGNGNGNGKPKPGGNGKPKPGGNGKPKPKPNPEGEIEKPVLRPNGCPVRGNIHWLVPHKFKCNLFYYCLWGEKVLRKCPNGLYFNPELQVCDWSWDAGCNKFSLSDYLLSKAEALIEN